VIGTLIIYEQLTISIAGRYTKKFASSRLTAHGTRVGVRQQECVAAGKARRSVRERSSGPRVACVFVCVSVEAREESKKGSPAADGREDGAEAEACRGSKLH